MTRPHRKAPDRGIDPARAAGFVAVHALAAAAPFAFSWHGVIAAAVLLVLTGQFGVCLGFHRLLAHRSFRTPPAVRYALAALGTLALQGGPLGWCAAHRRHHGHSDRPTDPQQSGEHFLRAHVLWALSTPGSTDDPLVADLRREPPLRWLERLHSPLNGLFAAALFAAGGLSLLAWGVGVRVVFFWHATFLVNSVCHRRGYRNFDTPDGSRNSWWVALLSFGEGWHNNHHAHPRRARHGWRWFELDPTYLALRVLRAAGLASHVVGRTTHRQGAAERTSDAPTLPPGGGWRWWTAAGRGTPTLRHDLVRAHSAADPPPTAFRTRLLTPPPARGPETPAVTPARLFLVAVPLVLAGVLAGRGGQPPRTGPATEKRFPPLQLPPGFKATLFACDPFIEYPSVIAAGPKANQLFVAVDYVTGLGEEIVRRDEVRLIGDTDGDGYADESTVFAAGFNSIQGLAYHDGTVYVMHAPLLTALRDTKGTGAADERKDLLAGLGLPPEQNRTRLHCANGVVAGHDGWLYLAMGDNGTDVKRPEGDRLVLNGGGILRCRPDGRDLHVFATGLRNVYDVALDAELNVFVRDNENDGGDYKIRVCHSFFGADHGYPYLYHERPDEALPPIADLGLGSSAGGVCYLERGFPPEYRGDLFFCEWGKSVVRYRPRPAGSGFGPVKEIEFAVAAGSDPYGFKPTDLVVGRDGAMFVSDWADGQRPKRGRGRIYRITPTEPLKGAEKSVAGLDSGSYAERVDAQLALQKQGAVGLKAVRQMLDAGKLGPRGRRHAVWILAHLGGAEALDELVEMAGVDAAVQVQAVRAVADLTDPVLVKHRLDPGPGDAAVAAKVAALTEVADSGVRREIVIALGRLRWSGTAEWIAKHVEKPDAPLAHAAMQTMRRSGNWPSVLRLLGRATDDPARVIALRAVADQHDPAIADDLIERLATSPDANRRRAYADLLARAHRKPGPWVYWGYRPGPRPANAIDWDRTAAVANALDRVLLDPDRAVRLAVLKRMQREKVPTRTETLTRWLREERGDEAAGVILDALRDAPAAETRAALEAVVREKGYGVPVRVRALAAFSAGLDADSAKRLLDLARGVEHGPVLAEVLRLLGRHPKLDAAKLLAANAESESPEVRAAAVESLAELRAPGGKDVALKLLGDREPDVRRAAAGAAGKLAVKEAAGALLKLATDADAAVRRASLDALRSLKEPRAVPLAAAALDDRVTQAVALELLGELGGPDQSDAVAALARRTPPADVLAAAVRLLSTWSEKRRELERTVAAIHGATGAVIRWTVSGPVAAKDAAGIVENFSRVPSAEANAPEWRVALAAAPEWRVAAGPTKGAAADAAWFGSTDMDVPDPAAVEFQLTGAGTAEVWLNGKSLFRRAETSTNRNAVARFTGELAKGPNRVLVRVGSPGAAVEFGLTFRRKSAQAAHEKLTQRALAEAGNAERGRKVFLDAEKSLCLKCHRVGDQGERVGPELTGVGARFGRVYLVESILEPGRSVVPGFATLRVELKDGRVLTGVKVAETDAALTLIDAEVKRHELKKADVLEQRPVAASTMPDGLEKRLTEQEFVDLISYLVSLKDRGSPK